MDSCIEKIPMHACPRGVNFTRKNYVQQRRHIVAKGLTVAHLNIMPIKGKTKGSGIYSSVRGFPRTPVKLPLRKHRR